MESDLDSQQGGSCHGASCRHTITQFQACGDSDCLLKDHKVRQHLANFISQSQEKLYAGELATPFNKEYVWLKSKVLGSGAFGTVYRCRHRSDKKYTFAVKEIPISAINGEASSLESVLDEAEILRKLGEEHVPHVVKLHSFYRSSSTAWLVMELLPGVSLDKLIPFLQKLPFEHHSAIAAVLGMNLLEMLQVSCHSQGITHSDIKPANIFVDVRDCQQMTHVLDWGLANQGQQGEKQILLKGTLAYLAPEVLQQWINAESHVVPIPCDPCKADLWSIGIVILETLLGKNPFQASWWRISWLQQCTQLRKQQGVWARQEKVPGKNLNEAFSKLPADAKSFVRALLHEDPRQRISVDTALQHPFLQLQ